MVGARLESDAAKVRAAAGLAGAACLLLVQACGRWGYGALPQLDELEPSAPGTGEVVAEPAPYDRQTGSALDAGSWALKDALDASFPADGWIRGARALSDAGSRRDAGVAGTSGPLRTASCDALPALWAVPTLDGTLEDGLATQPVEPQHWTGTDQVPVGHALAYAAAWHSLGLYFYLEVTDPDRNPATPSTEVWQGDGVEVYVDHDGVFAAAGTFDDPGTRQLIFAAPADDVSNADRGEAYVTPAGRIGPYAATDWIAMPTPSGYAFELWVTAADLGLSTWSLAAGDQVGFDLAHNVSLPVGQTGTQGNRAGQYFLRVGPQTDVSTYPFYNSGVFCAPTLTP